MLASHMAVLIIPVMAGAVLGVSFGVATYDDQKDAIYDSDSLDPTKVLDLSGEPPDVRLLPPAGSQKTAALYASSLTSNGSPALGSSTAGVTMIEWGDYQCTYCYLFHNSTLDAIKATYVDSGEVRVIFKDFALNGADSVLAAAASHCAGDQSRYWEYHDTLYANWGGERTGWVTQDALDAFASATGLDVPEFKKCMASEAHIQAVADAYVAGQMIGIDATPSFIIFNDTHAVKIRGNQPLEVFLNAIERLRTDT